MYNSPLSDPRRKGRRRQRQAPLAAAAILVGAVLAFALAFSLFWQLGDRVVGGEFDVGVPSIGFPSIGLPSLPGFGGDEEAIAAVPAREYRVTPDLSLGNFRDQAYRPVKGIYLSSWAAGHNGILTDQLALVDRTELNAMVIDAKDATGYVTYDANVQLSDELGMEEERIRDIDGLIATLREHDIVPIARIVVFKDPLLAEKHPEWAVQNVNGGVWKDNKGFAYMNPYKREVWDYVLDVAEDAAGHGFREIQWDYVRFPSDGKISETSYPGEYGPKEDAIADFLAYSRQRLEPLGVWVSADVFGLTLYEKNDMGIGQKIEKVSRSVDIVSPMIYPSHYYSGHYNLDNPNAQPYEVVKLATEDATRRMDGTGAIYRPWLQDFSLGGVEYGVDEVKAQIRAVEEQGYNEWILWDPSVKYVEGALRPAS